jgi:hypothetical protein
MLNKDVNKSIIRFFFLKKKTAWKIKNKIIFKKNLNFLESLNFL